MTKALCPGSFDPLTLGHVDVIERCIARFDSVTVAVVDNPSKSSLFTAGERKSLIEATFADRVSVASFDGLLVDFAASVGADVVVKGLRGLADFEVEQQMAQMNRQVGGMDTMFMATKPEYSYLSSSLVKEVAKLGGDVESLVPAAVARALKERYG